MGGWQDGPLYEMPKSHDLGHVHDHVIRMSKPPKIAKIDSIRLAVPHYVIYTRGFISRCNY